MIEKSFNKRYRFLTHDNRTYLVDSDSHFVVWFFPWLIWFFPFKIYECDEGCKLKEKQREGSKGLIVLISSVLSVLIIKVVPTEYFTSDLFPYHEIPLSIFLLVIMILIFLIRCYVSKKRLYQGKVFRTGIIKLDFFKYYKENMRFFLLFSFGALFTGLILKEFFFQFITSGNPIYFLLFLLVYTFFLFANQSIQVPEKYDIKFQELK